MIQDLETRLQLLRDAVSTTVGAFALLRFLSLAEIAVETKGEADYVSTVNRDSESLARQLMAYSADRRISMAALKTRCAICGENAGKFSLSNIFSLERKMVMERVIYVGLDVHAETIAVATADDGRSGEFRFYGVIENTTDSVLHLTKRLSATG
ncbi:hypothetical protein [Rhizobium sp. NPDC090279]|uniref:hypothetical protein n=1 Tax=Rhizobium sp. NPDC090279 TaxID=3364499 RepID=UPI00383A228F